MIEIHIQNRVAGRIDHTNVLDALQIVLDKEKFFGTILLTYEHGQLQSVKAQQHFTVDGLVDHLSR